MCGAEMGEVEFSRPSSPMVEHLPTDETAVAESPSNTPAETDSNGFSVAFTPERQRRRRVRYEPRTDADGWWRIDEEWTGCTWRINGREPVVDVVLRRLKNE